MDYRLQPTDNQINTLYSWYRWRLPTQMAKDAVHWLKMHSTRKEVSKEIARVHELYHGFKLDKDTCFDSPIWDNYKKELDNGQSS